MGVGSIHPNSSVQPRQRKGIGIEDKRIMVGTRQFEDRLFNSFWAAPL